MKTLLVTGATGFLGKKTCLYFVKKKFKVIGIGRNEQEGKILSENGVLFIKCDITSAKNLETVFQNKIDIIIHCAALSSPWGKRKDFFKINVEPTQNIIELSKKNNITKFIYISSPSIYFDFQDKFNLNEKTKIASPPPSLYSETKYEAEKLVSSSINHTFKAIILRPRGLFGPGDQSLMPKLIRAHNTGKLKIIGTGDNKTDLTYIDNVVHAIELSIEKIDIHSGEVFNITNDSPVDLWKFINQILLELNRKPIKRKVSYRFAFALAYLLEKFHTLFIPNKEPLLTRYTCSLLAKSQTLDIQKAKDLLNYTAKVNMEDGLKNYIKWYKEKEND